LGCAFTALDIGCLLDEGNLEFTCSCPEGYATRTGESSHKLRVDQLTDFPGCFSDRPFPPVKQILRRLAENAGGNFERGVYQVVSGVIHSSFVSIDSEAGTLVITITIRTGTSQDQAVAELRQYIAYLLNIHLDQVVTHAEQAQKRDTTLTVSITIVGDVIVASAPRLGVTMLFALLVTLLTIFL
jgi:hypothetical protein